MPFVDPIKDETLVADGVAPETPQPVAPARLLGAAFRQDNEVVSLARSMWDGAFPPVPDYNPLPDIKGTPYFDQHADAFGHRSAGTEAGGHSPGARQPRAAHGQRSLAANGDQPGRRVGDAGDELRRHAAEAGSIENLSIRLFLVDPALDVFGLAVQGGDDGQLGTDGAQLFGVAHRLRINSLLHDSPDIILNGSLTARLLLFDQFIFTHDLFNLPPGNPSGQGGTADNGTQDTQTPSPQLPIVIGIWHALTPHTRLQF